MLSNFVEVAADVRRRLLAGIPVTSRRLTAAGIPTTVVEGGTGPPMVLLHGPGESAAKWLRVLPALLATHRVVAPDLPGHGESAVPDGEIGPDRLTSWLGELVERTCAEPPVIVGHVLGGAIAARYAAAGGRLSRLVLVDSLGLVRFLPKPAFAVTMIAFQARPSAGSYERFMRQCSYDLDRLRSDLGDRWEPYADYAVAIARSPRSALVGRLLRTAGIPRIPAEVLDRITVPTALIWGEHDRANRVASVRAVADRHGWPLHVVADCADDPPRDQPEGFLRALHAVLEG